MCRHAWAVYIFVFFILVVCVSKQTYFIVYYMTRKKHNVNTFFILFWNFFVFLHVQEKHVCVRLIVAEHFNVRVFGRAHLNEQKKKKKQDTFCGWIMRSHLRTLEINISEHAETRKEMCLYSYRVLLKT